MFLTTSNNDRSLEKGIIKICLILWQRVAVATRDYYVCIIIAIFLLPPFLRRRSSLCIFWRNSHRHTVNFLLIHWHGLRQNCSHSQNWYKLRKKSSLKCTLTSLWHVLEPGPLQEDWTATPTEYVGKCSFNSGNPFKERNQVFHLIARHILSKVKSDLK